MQKKIIQHLLLIILFIFNIASIGKPSPFIFPHQAAININFENINVAKGSIRMALYRSAETFLDTDNAFAYYSFKINEKGSLKVTIEGIEFGEYAVAVFHDENDNDKLETNFFGIPIEPYCFSGSGHSKWKPPVFENAKFEVSKNEINLTLRLEKWKL